MGTAALSAVCWRTSQGQRERQQSVDGCVLCSITALTDMGEEGRRERREEIKWFNLGWVLKSLRESGVKMGKCCPIACICSFFLMNECSSKCGGRARKHWKGKLPVRHRDNFSVGSGNLVLISRRRPRCRDSHSSCIIS